MATGRLPYYLITDGVLVYRRMGLVHVSTSIHQLAYINFCNFLYRIDLQYVKHLQHTLHRIVNGIIE